MKYYKTGEFAKLAGLSIRTIHYYDEIGLLKPSQIAENGYHLYSDTDFMKLQIIISLKNLGFSLDDILSMTSDSSQLSIKDLLHLQKELINREIKQLIEMKAAINEAEDDLENNKDINWTQLLNSTNFNLMEKRLVDQYKKTK